MTATEARAVSKAARAAVKAARATANAASVAAKMAKKAAKVARAAAREAKNEARIIESEVDYDEAADEYLVAIQLAAEAEYHEALAATYSYDEPDDEPSPGSYLDKDTRDFIEEVEAELGPSGGAYYYGRWNRTVHED